MPSSSNHRGLLSMKGSRMTAPSAAQSATRTTAGREPMPGGGDAGDANRGGGAASDTRGL